MDAQAEPSVLSAPDPNRAYLSNPELRSIFSNLSHELSRPLISLRMGFDLILTDQARAISNDQLGHVQTMIVLCDELLCLTRNSLDYAQLVEGTRPLCFGEFTIGALIREIDRQFSPTAAVRRIAWNCTLGGIDATVTTDATRCQQIFGNLVTNALKYTPEGGEVTVKAHTQEAHWVVTVGDNGPGIPAESIERVFEPFFRLSRDDHSRGGGNGLGLAICREMVDQLAGHVQLQSGFGQGTTVTVRMPIEPPQHPDLGRRTQVDLPA